MLPELVGAFIRPAGGVVVFRVIESEPVAGFHHRAGAEQRLLVAVLVCLLPARRNLFPQRLRQDELPPHQRVQADLPGFRQVGGETNLKF